MTPTPLPKYIYKILPCAPVDPIPDEYPLSELDQKDGFVHLSTAAQVPITADLFFTDTTSIWVLKINFQGSGLESVTEWEGDGCAHLFGNFGKGDVDSVRRFERGDCGEKWAESIGSNMSGSMWLE
ncbi:hypothetical protein FQN53_008118 [Emmonsiellopsis sp. PD_33]|nr:hypothetical protein FQN53_008118 [Emmonsiellopsis sp. PD_33]